MENKEQIEELSIDNSKDIEQNTIEQNTEEKVPKHKSKKKFVISILAVIAVIAIGIGVYTAYISNPKRIIATAIDKVSSNLKDMMNFDDKSKMGENYTLKGNIKLDVESDYLSALGTYNTEYQPYINLVNNLSKIDTNFTVIQNKKDEQLFAAVNSTFNNEELINAKYLIKNNTEYYFIKDFLATYINNGNNNYFETLNESATSNENIEYIYDFCIKSFKKNLKDSYFAKETVKQMINDKEEKLTKVTLKVNNEVAKEIANNILKDLKADKKANKILTGLNKDFNDTKIDNDATLFVGKEEINIIVYVDRFTSKAKKYEFSIVDSSNSMAISYEDNKETDKLKISYNNAVIIIMDISEKNDTTTIDIKDSSNNKLATIKAFESDDNYNLTFNGEIESIAIDVEATSKTTEIKKNKNYKSDSTVEAKITSDNTVFGKMKLDMTSEITDEANINEDVSNSVLSSSITDTQKTSLQTKLTEILIKLMS